MSSKDDKVYFPGLNFLRFLAASIVIIYHTELFKRYYPASYKLNDCLFLENCGQMAVNFFFVLSGYLITYLLIVEKKKHKTVFIKYFYMRRILRIWPLYYTVLTVGFVILYVFNENPHSISNSSIVLYILILPNLAGLFGQDILISHLWSIGVEEQFYIIWPILIKCFNSVIKVCIVFISFFVILNISIWSAHKLNLYDSDFLVGLLRLLQGIRMHCLVIGAIGAYLFYTQHASLKFIYHPVSQFVSYGFTAYMLFSNFRFPAINNEIYCFFFVIILLNISTNPKSFFKLEYSWTGFFGKISYGMYMYHAFAIKMTLYIFTIYFKNTLDSFLSNIFCHLFAIGATMLFASCSYFFVEKKILKFKNKFSKIESISAR